MVEIEIFGEAGRQLILFPRSILPRISGLARDWPMEVFDELRKANPSLCFQLNWYEVFGRAFLASDLTLWRNDQWARCVAANYAAGSYLGFAGGLRGYLEAAADSYYSLSDAALLIATNWKSLNACLNDEGSWPVPKELEQKLIHFQYARGHQKKEVVPEGHSALKTRDYLDAVKGFDAGLEPLYKELCELVHPAAPSVQWMFDTSYADYCYTFRVQGAAGAKERICDLLDRHREPLLSMLMAGTNSALILLKLLRKLDHEDFDLAFMDTVDLSAIKRWQKIDLLTS